MGGQGLDGEGRCCDGKTLCGANKSSLLTNMTTKAP